MITFHWYYFVLLKIFLKTFYTKYSIRILCEYLENHPQADIRYYLKNSFTLDFCLLGYLKWYNWYLKRKGPLDEAIWSRFLFMPFSEPCQNPFPGEYIHFTEKKFLLLLHGSFHTITVSVLFITTVGIIK